METINRAVVKSQARELIKGKWIYLAIITLVVGLLTTNSMSILTNVDSISDDFKNAFNKHSYSYDFKPNDNQSDFERFGNSSDFENFGFDDDDAVTDDDADDFDYDDKDFDLDNFFGGLEDNSNTKPKTNMISKHASSPVGLLNLIMMPLVVTLTGIYLALIRKNPESEFEFSKEFGGLFKNSFNNTYLKKFSLVLLRQIFTILLLCCFVIPGVLYYYSTYFSYQILSDNPNMSPTEAAKLSRKMVKGNRGELFLMNLSFIGWFLLVCVTFGIASIYVTPYFMTTDALYYENFRMRALQYGKITLADFGQANPRVQHSTGLIFSYARPEENNTEYYYNPQTQRESSQQNDTGSYYSPAPQEADTYYSPEPQQSSEYYTPPQENYNIEESHTNPSDIENSAD